MMMRRTLPMLVMFTTMLACGAAFAQAPADGDLPEAVDPPADWRAHSGIGVGMAIREIADLEGKPFNETLVQPYNRPAIGLDIVRRGRNVLVLEDNDGSIKRASFSGQSAWQEVSRTVYSLYPDRFDMVMALTEWQERSAFAYYLPLANDTRGIGYLHLSGRDIFNQTGSNLDGLIFMNDYRSYIGRNEVFGRVVFLQEIGHRWGSFVYYGNGPSNGRDLLGRDESHWSFFMHTENSALEGNAWRDNLNGSFTTETNAFRLGFSQLDNYLMGFLPPSEVEDFFIISSPDVRGQRDSFGQTINPASGPAFERPITINGTRQTVKIDDVITAEGNRNPSFETSQKVWNVATVLILDQGSGSTWSDSKQDVVESLIDSWEVMFEEETGGVADLVFTLEDTPPEPESNFGELCTSTADCNPANSTVCLTTDSGSICSKRCADISECGAGYCCAEDFCYPTTDTQCQELLPDSCTQDSECGFGCCVEGQCGDCPTDPEPEPSQEEECIDGFAPNGFACECQGFGCPSSNSSATGNVQAGCQSLPGQTAPFGALFMLLGLALCLRRGGPEDRKKA